MTVSENPKPVTAYCRACGKALTEDTARVAMGTVYCEEHLPAQGQPQAASPYTAASIPNPGVSPGLAFLLGLLPGVGAIYNGQYAKGLVHVLILGLLISIMSSGSAGGLEPLFGMVLGVFYFYMAFEAYHTARKRMLGEPVDEFSSLVQVKSGPGTLPILPIALIGLGVLFLLNNLELLRLRAVLRYWPVVLIMAGGWMLYSRLVDGSEPKPPTIEPDSTVPPAVPPAVPPSSTGGAL
jgi:TM2 domain-containing membrane protein YozV